MESLKPRAQQRSQHPVGPRRQIPKSCLLPLGNTWRNARSRAAWQRGLPRAVGAGMPSARSGEDPAPLHSCPFPRQAPQGTLHPSSPREPPALTPREAPSCQRPPCEALWVLTARPKGTASSGSGRRPNQGSGLPPRPELPDSLVRPGEPWARGCGAGRPRPAARRWPAASPGPTCWAPGPQARPWSRPPVPARPGAHWARRVPGRGGPLPSPARTCPTALAPLPESSCSSQRPRPGAS